MDTASRPPELSPISPHTDTTAGLASSDSPRFVALEQAAVLPTGSATYKPVKALNPETARKIAAGEVIDRPAAVIRELLDNAIDAGSSKVQVEISGGGIERIRVTDNGCGMSREDLAICTDTHTTSKISTAEDLLSLHSLGFRGEALSSIKAVSNLEITSTRSGPAAWKLQLGKIFPARLNAGTVVQVENLFENFPARKQFLKRAAAETALCRTVFLDKALPHYTIEMRFITDGELRFLLPSTQSLRERCLAAFSFKEPETLFFEIEGNGEHFSFRIVLGSPDVVRSDKRAIMVFVNGRRITEFGLTQAIDYGGEGYFPNGGHPVAFLFLTVAPSRVDFNIHPAKKEARFQDYSAIHHAVSSAVGSFYRQHTVASLLKEKYDPDLTRPLDFQRGESDGNLKQQSGIQSEYGNRQDGYGSAFRQIAATAAVPYSAGGHIIPPPAAMGTSFVDEAWESISYAAATGSVAQGTAPVASEMAPYMQNPPDIPPADFKLLGQVAGTFIAVEKNDALYLIDQHAAHERIIFEQLQHNIGGGAGAVNPLPDYHLIGRRRCVYQEAPRVVVQGGVCSCR